MNVAHLIDEHPDERVALVSQGRPIDYGTLRAEVARLRGGLATLGIARGDRVVVLCGNGPSFVSAYLAVVGLGAVAVPLNPAAPARELAREVTAIDATVALVGPLAASAWRSITDEEVPALRHVIALDGAKIDGALDGRTLSGPPPAVVDVTEDELAVMIFTSGTAGAPQAAMLTHANLLANIAQAQRTSDWISCDDVVFGVLPLHHIFGLNVILGICLSTGASLVLVQRFDPATALQTIRDRGVTVVPGAPPMWVAWAGFASARREDFAGVRLALSGAAKLPEDVFNAMQERFGVTICEGYGLTEAGPTVTTSTGGPVRPGSIGKVLAGIEVRLVDEQGEDAPDGDPGEIWVRGPNVFVGYWGNERATASTLTSDGWLRTGDVAITDADGYLYIVDRAKDLIIVSGFNVYPAEVEEALAEHPGVAEVAVIGVPHPHTGEAVRAYVVARDGERLDEDELIEFCLDHLARYKCPSKVLFVDRLPRGMTGKLLRRALAAEAL